MHWFTTGKTPVKKTKQGWSSAPDFPVLRMAIHGHNPISMTILSHFISHTLSTEMPSWTAVALCRSNKDSSEAVKEGVDSLYLRLAGAGLICSLDGLKNPIHYNTIQKYDMR